MMKIIVALGIVLSCCITGWTDYLADRRAALALVQAGKNDEALTAFTNMAGSAASELQKSDSLEQAAGCANRLKQYDRALDLAKSIPLPAVSKKCRMSLLGENRKYSELIAEFKTEDIDEWPETSRPKTPRGISMYAGKSSARKNRNFPPFPRPVPGSKCR